jgi:hypothetical protein
MVFLFTKSHLAVPAPDGLVCDTRQMKKRPNHPICLPACNDQNVLETIKEKRLLNSGDRTRDGFDALCCVTLVAFHATPITLSTTKTDDMNEQKAECYSALERPEVAQVPRKASKRL